MAFTDYVRRQKQAAQANMGFQTQPGDPNFSYASNPGSQMQFPAAAAESRIQEVQTRGVNRLADATAAGYDVNQPQYDPLRQAAGQGFTERALTLGEGLLGWLDGPRQAVNLLIQDLVGGEAEGGLRNPNFGDYWNAMWGGVEDTATFENATGLNPRSGSMTLDMFGWEEEDSLPGKIGRGVADFGFQMLTDPLTYVTFGLSGLGKKAAQGAAHALQRETIDAILPVLRAGADDAAVAGLSQYQRYLVKNIDPIVNDFQETLLSQAGKFGDEAFPPDVQRALSNYLGEGEDPWGHITELALANRISDDVMKPLLNRNFNGINALAREELPLWARGGMRISIPFTQNALSHGAQVPGTIGVGKKLIGDPLRQVSERLKSLGPYKSITKGLDNFKDDMDVMRPLLQGLKASTVNGGIAGWQYEIAMSSLDSIHNQGATELINVMLRDKLGGISELVNTHGLDQAQVNAVLMNRLENADVDSVAVRQAQAIFGEDSAIAPDIVSLYPELDQQLTDVARFLRGTYDDFHKKLAALDPTVRSRFIDGYTPHKATVQGGSILDDLAQAGAAPPRREWSEALDAGDPGKALFARLIQGRGKGGRLETNMGGTGYNPKNAFERMSAVTIGDSDATVLLDQDFTDHLRAAIPDVITEEGVDKSLMQSKFIPVTVLNELLEPVVREQASKWGVHLGAWDGKVFSEDAFETASTYLTNMNDAIRMWTATNALRTAGLAMNFSTAVDTQDVVQKLFSNIVKHTEKVQVSKFGTPPPDTIKVDAPISFLQKVRTFDMDPDRQFQYHGNEAFGEIEAPSEAIMAGRPTRASKENFIADVESKGVTSPLTVGIDANGRAVLLDGHRRLEAAEELGISELPVRFVPTEYEGVLDVSDYLKTREGLGVPGNVDPRAEFADLTKGTELNPVSPAEQGLAIEASMAWAHDSEKLKTAISKLADGEVPLNAGGRTKTERQAAALIRKFQREAKPFSELGLSGEDLVRVTQTKLDLANFEPGEIVDIPYASSAPTDTNKFLKTTGTTPDYEPATKKFVDNTDKWIFRFDEATPALDNTAHNMFEPEVFVSGKFRVVDADVESHYATLEYVEPSFSIVPEVKAMPSISSGFDVKTDVVSDRFHSLPWGAEPVGQNKNLLKGETGLGYTVLPNKVVKDLKAAGLNDADLTDVHNMLALGQMNKKEFMQLSPRAVGASAPPRPPTDNPLLLLDEDGVFQIQLPSGALDLHARRRAVDAVMDQLDDQLTRGDTMLGDVSYENMLKLAQNAADETTSKLLYRYLNRKLASLPEATAEHIMKEPAELLGTRALFDDWADEVNTFVRDYAAISQNGQLIADPNQLKVLGDKDVVNRIERMKVAAEKLGEAGYDEAVKIMRGIDDVTSIPDPNFVNPSVYALAGPAVDGMAVQKDVAKFLRNIARNSAMMYTPEGVAAAKIATNNALRWWRAMATIARPSFHVRNMVGGSWMNMIHGVTNKDYGMVAKSAPLLRKALKEGKSYEEAFASLEPHAAQVLKKAWDMDVMSGFASTEFRKPRGMPEKGEILKWAKVWDVDDFALTKMGGHFMENIEDLLRVSLFSHYYDPAKAGSEILARDMVNATHFDYVNLTPLETKLKSLIPFFVWTRRNLPRQLELAFENPRYVQKYQHMMQAMNDNLGGNDLGLLPESDNMSAFAAGTNYFVNKDTPFWARVMIDPDLPIHDLINLPTPSVGNVVDYANDILGPHVSTLVNVNEQRDFGDVNAPAPFNAVLKSLAAVGLYDSTTDGDVRIPYYMRSVLETAFPFMRETVEPIMGGPTDPNRQQRTGISQDDGGLESVMKDIAGIGLRGLGVKFTTPADVRSKTARTNDELDRLIQELRMQGQFPAGEGG